LEFFILFPETFDSPGGVDELLFSGEKGMALGTDFNSDIGFRGTDFDLIAAGASNGGLFVFGVNLAFHGVGFFLSDLY
jgi:hypothetical protein